MPHETPAFLQLYAEEMKELYDKKFFKITFSGIVGGIASWVAVELLQLILGLCILAIIDVLVSLIPGNVKKGQEKDQIMQAKLIAFSTNFGILIAFELAGGYLRGYTKEAFFLGLFSKNIHYVVAIWIYSIYFYRFVIYVSRANNIKIPSKIMKMFDKDASS